ncbi:PAS domain-containing protein [Roseivirga sp. BDSF3-8]|uniref:sensor histidine kinase n=1 Tax=Roseivirga sp. BDSF3-8 TaxID=3241598 RepID=UPI003531E863
MDTLKDIPLNTIKDQEEKRLQNLHTYAVFDIEQEPELNELINLLADICHTPIAFISFIDKDCQKFKACTGIDIKDTPREIAFCDITIRNNELLVIPDTQEDERLKDNPLVKNPPHIRFYAGMPLTTPAGFNIGTLCIADFQPRCLSESQEKLMKVQARQVVQYLELRKKEKELAVSEKELSLTKKSVASREAVLNRAQKAASVAIFDIDLCNDNVIYSPCFASLIGINDSRQLAVSSYLEFIIREDRHIFLNMVNDARRGNAFLEATYRCVREDTGEIIYMNTRAEVLYNDAGNPCNILGVNHDITEQKTYEQKLIDNEKRWKLALEGAKEGVWDWNLDTSEIFFSAQWKLIIGYRDDEIKNQPDEWMNRVHPDDIQNFSHCLKKCMSNVGEEPNVNEHRLKHKEGFYKWVRIRGKVLSRDDEGNAIRLMGTMTDVSEQKKVEMNLESRNVALKKAHFELDNFVYRLSHDLRAPLASSLGLIDVVRHLDNIEEINRMLTLLENSLNKQDKTIYDIIEYSKNSRFKVQNVEVDLHGLVDEAFESMLTKHKPEKGVVFENKVSGKVVSDPYRLNLIFQNILDNCFHYTDKHCDQILVTAEDRCINGTQVIKIEDNGIGIKPAYQEKVFNMFFRATELSTGSGLGLYIAREALYKLKGHISLQSDIGKGTLVIIKIPMVDANLKGQ